MTMVPTHYDNGGKETWSIPKISMWSREACNVVIVSEFALISNQSKQTMKFIHFIFSVPFFFSLFPAGNQDHF